MLGALVVALLTAALTPEQMKDWGWRVPFVIGILTVPVGAYIRRNLEETLEPSRARARARSDHQPLRRVLAAQGRGGQGILLVIGGMVCAQIIGFYMPAYANKELGLPATSTLSASVVLGAIGFVAAPVGLLADRVTQARDFLGASRHRGRAVAVLPMAGVGAEQRG